MQDAKKLQIVCFENPFPANYGGVIDVFYRIQALHALGIEITLHCFVTDRTEVKPELQALCKSVHLYPKERKIGQLFSQYPLSVVSRFHTNLTKQLLASDAPILIEGLQSSFLATLPAFRDRKLYLRLHNLESVYYNGLANSETNWIKQLLYRWEAKKYQKYEAYLNRFATIFTISKRETLEVAKVAHAQYLPPFHGNERCTSAVGMGDFALYHGDLRLSDNKRAALFLFNVFSELPQRKLVVAASDIPESIKQEAKRFSNVTVIETQSQAELFTYVRQAQMNVMLSFQPSGTKLKAINALYMGRHCIVNENMIDDTELLKLCVVCTQKSDFIREIDRHFSVPFDPQNRTAILSSQLSDRAGAEQLISEIFLFRS